MSLNEMKIAINPRTPDFGRIDGLAEACPRERSLEMFQRMCEIRAFDLHARQAQMDKQVEALIYLSVGQEATAAAVSMSMRGAWVLGQHRAHSVYIAFDGNRAALVDELLGMDSGCCRGMGGSPPIQDIAKRIIGHNGLIGDQVPVATGVALGDPGSKVVVFFGDGAAEEDYIYPSFGFAASRRLPILFICEDNDLSVLTPTADRRNWSLTNVAAGFGMKAVDIADDPWLIDHWTRELSTQLPAVLNIRTCRELWHVGVGSDGPPEWNRYELTKQVLCEMQLTREVEDIETATLEKTRALWQERLRIQSGN